MENCAELPNQTLCFSQDERDALYKTIFNRRDVRGQFKSDPIPDDVLARILQASHHAPSVGFMQPWNFMVIRSENIKQKIHQGFLEANAEAAEMFETERQDTYRSLKLEGIIESPLNICITCDRARSGPNVIGRTHIKTMDLYSTVCAVQNFWLAARAEGLGVGWVSIIKPQTLKDALGIPPNIVPIAYLCVGYVSHFHQKPELETAGWRKRIPLEELVFFDQWQERRDANQDNLIQEIENSSGFSEQYIERR